MKNAILTSAVLLMVTVFAAPAAADIMAVTPVPNDPNLWGLTTPNDSLTYAITTGFSFTPTTNITVTALGFCNYWGDLASNEFDVGIYSGNYDGSFTPGSATLVGSATVTGSDPNYGTYWNFAPVSLALTAGTTYTLAAGDKDGNYQGTVPYWDPDRGNEYLNRYVALGSEIGYISSSNGAAGYGGDGTLQPLTFSWGNAASGNPVPILGNFLYTPEPGTMALLALGGVALLRRRRV